MQQISNTDLILGSDGSVYHLGLHPEQVADKVIGVGDQARVEEVSRHFDSIEFKNNNREFVTHTGMLGGKRLTVMSTGIGPDNVEIFFTELDALVNINLKTREPLPGRKSLTVVRLGTSGAMREEIALGTHLVTDYAVGLDNLMHFYDLPMESLESEISFGLQKHTGLPFQPYVVRGSIDLREQMGSNMIVGNTLTCPGFYAPQGRHVRLVGRLPDFLKDLNSFRAGGFVLSNLEMETAAYFAFGKLLGHRTASVNAIIANRVTQQFATNPKGVVDALIEEVLAKI